jgi:hypothetical protein
MEREIVIAQLAFQGILVGKIGPCYEMIAKKENTSKRMKWKKIKNIYNGGGADSSVVLSIGGTLGSQTMAAGAGMKEGHH